MGEVLPNTLDRTRGDKSEGEASLRFCFVSNRFIPQGVAVWTFNQAGKLIP